MSAEFNLVSELAIILIAAGTFTVISKVLKQPLILGYIVAGFIVGPHLGIFPQFSPESVHEWSELGIIFLLFGLGLEFSFKKLMNVGSAAAITAGTICIGMFITGFITGTALGWTKMECIFLGGMLSMSSTTIIIKAYDDLGLKKAPYAPLVFGLLVVEDLIAVLMMVLFSTIAVSNKFSGTDMIQSLLKLVSFLVICFVVGIYVIPTILKKTRKYLTDEILLLISIGLCFLMVWLAGVLGFSSALGAFLMGSILSSALEGERIEHITGNIKNLFGAIFFVSVGMMIDPAVIAQYWPIILIITAVVLVGILLFSSLGALLAGKDLDTAVHVGFSLPQLGEFSFIIASLGCTLGVVSDYIYPVIISVSVITTFTTPYMIKAANPASVFLRNHLPEKFVSRLGRSEGAEFTKAELSIGKQFVKKYVIRVGIHTLICSALLIGFSELLPALLQRYAPHLLQHPKLTTIVEVVISLAIMAPFLIELAVKGQPLKNIAKTLVENNPHARIPVRAAIIFRIFLATQFAVSAILIFVPLSMWIILVIVAALIAAFILGRRATEEYGGMEKHFYENLNAKEELERQNAPVRTMFSKKFSNYDIHIETVSISPDFPLVGKTLREMPFRDHSGVNIVKIRRGSHSILIPRGGEIIMPGDELFAVGTNEQLEAFLARMSEANAVKTEDQAHDAFSVDSIVLSEKSPLTGKVLKDTDMRSSGCMVVSVIRDEVLHTNPDKNFVFAKGDIVWLAGLRSSIEWYGRQPEIPAAK